MVDRAASVEGLAVPHVPSVRAITREGEGADPNPVRQTESAVPAGGVRPRRGLIAGCVYELGHRVHPMQRINHMPISRIITDLR